MTLVSLEQLFKNFCISECTTIIQGKGTIG